MSDSETSQDVTYGHHETWDDFVETQATQVKKLEREVSVAQLRLDHALWHCSVYRDSLRKLPGGYAQHKQSLAEHQEKLDKDGPACLECERDQLLERIAYLEERLRSATLKSEENERPEQCNGKAKEDQVPPS